MCIHKYHFFCLLVVGSGSYQTVPAIYVKFNALLRHTATHTVRGGESGRRTYANHITHTRLRRPTQLYVCIALSNMKHET